jgi:hypothetical protein
VGDRRDDGDAVGLIEPPRRLNPPAPGLDFFDGNSDLDDVYITLTLALSRRGRGTLIFPA